MRNTFKFKYDPAKNLAKRELERQEISRAVAVEKIDARERVHIAWRIIEIRDDARKSGRRLSRAETMDALREQGSRMVKLVGPALQRAGHKYIKYANEAGA